MSNALALQSRPQLGTAPFSGRQTSSFLTWLACWLFLPNLPFLPITALGGPPRFMEVLACGIVGLVGRRLPYPLRAAVWIALLGWLLCNFIARMFNLDVSMIMSVAGLIFDLDLMASTEYVAGGALLLVSAALALFLLRRPADFDRPLLLLAAVATTIVAAAADYAVSHDTMGSYTRIAPEGAPNDSAVERSGLPALADGKANIVIVLVEAMGEPTDPQLRARLDAIWMRPALRDRYEITHGRTAFYGSTTSGTVRELCGRWGNFPEIEAADSGCLPARLRRAGYRTRGYHGFTADFFDRERWWPLIGIDAATFGPDLIKRGARLCINVFTGACDADVPRLIGSDLVASQGPQFVYWVTLNSHLPVIKSTTLGTERCRQFGPEKDADLPMVCRLFTLWEKAATSLTAMALRPDLPPTHILIVGDHMPPFTQQKSRLQFDPAHVPWILLRDRRARQGAATGRNRD